MTSLKFTGERFVPGNTPFVDVAAYHLSRYEFAFNYAQDRRILDLGSGSGYGSSMLAKVARSVTACDIAFDALNFSLSNYARENVRFIQADCRHLGFPKSTFDLVVCFEVIEHIKEHEELLSQVKRVMSPNGTFIVSTPERLKYNTNRKSPNEYHVRELTEAEFGGLLSQYFTNVKIYWQTLDPLIQLLLQQESRLAKLERKQKYLETTMNHPLRWLLRVLTPAALKRQLSSRRAGKPGYLPVPDGAPKTSLSFINSGHISIGEQPTEDSVYMVAVCS